MDIAIITGGSSGLGFEIARNLVENNINVLLVSRSKSKLKYAKDQMTAEGNSLVETFSCDIGNENMVKNLYKFVSDRNYHVNYLFNVAGIGLYSSVDEITLGDIQKIFASNLIGLMLICKTFINHFNSNSHNARIVNILSTAALKGKKMESIYYAAKWGARGFTESLKDELQDTNTEIITVYPGGMKTPFWEDSKASYETSDFMDPSEVGKVITDIALNHKVYISELTINRPKQRD